MTSDAIRFDVAETSPPEPLNINDAVTPFTQRSETAQERTPYEQWQGVMAAQFDEGRLAGRMEEVPSDNPTSVIRPGDILRIVINGRTEYFLAFNSQVGHDGAGLVNLQDVLNRSIRAGATIHSVGESRTG